MIRFYDTCDYCCLPIEDMEEGGRRVETVGRSALSVPSIRGGSLHTLLI